MAQTPSAAACPDGLSVSINEAFIRKLSPADAAAHTASMKALMDSTSVPDITRGGTRAAGQAAGPPAG